jgi:hypothetical protein
MSMAPFAHIGGMPFEELLPWASGASVALLAGRAWVATLAARLRRRSR